MAAGTAADLVRLQCPGVTSELAAVQIARAARAFFIATECWTKTIETVTVANQAQYNLAAVLDEFGEVARIVSLTMDGNEVDMSRYSLKGQTLVFVTAPTAVYDLEIEVVVVSNPMIAFSVWGGTGEKTDDELMTESFGAAIAPYTEALSEYALFLLRSMPGVPWSHTDMALVHLGRYQAEVFREKFKQFTGGMSAQITASSGGPFV